MPFPRYRLRTLLIAVAIVAVTLGGLAVVERRRERFQRLFSYHRSNTGPMSIRTFAPDHPLFETARGRWHYELSEKYGQAARQPWLPVAPDPPPPD